MDAANRVSDGVVTYDIASIFFHWCLAALITIAFFIGLYMVGLPFSPSRLRLYNWHKWLGMTALVLSVARLYLIATRPAPQLPKMPAWQLVARHGTHLAFYILFFVVPLLGWLYTSSVGVPVVWLGWVPLPDLVPLDKVLGEDVLKPLHRVASYVLGGLVLLHTSAALKHHFIDRDRLLWHMWPSRGRWRR